MTVTEGLGYGLVNLFTDSGSRNIEDYRIGYFQIGEASGFYSEGNNIIYELSSALLYTSSYGSATPYIVTSLDQIIKENGNFITSSNIIFVEIPKNSVTNMAIGYSRVLIKSNGTTPEPDTQLKEFGLFMKNPDGKKNKDKPIMVAYKVYPNSILSAVDLGFTLEWIITFANI